MSSFLAAPLSVAKGTKADPESCLGGPLTSTLISGVHRNVSVGKGAARHATSVPRPLFKNLTLANMETLQDRNKLSSAFRANSPIQPAMTELLNYILFIIIGNKHFFFKKTAVNYWLIKWWRSGCIWQTDRTPVIQSEGGKQKPKDEQRPTQQNSRQLCDSTRGTPHTRSPIHPLHVTAYLPLTCRRRRRLLLPPFLSGRAEPGQGAGSLEERVQIGPAVNFRWPINPDEVGMESWSFQLVPGRPRTFGFSHRCYTLNLKTLSSSRLLKKPRWSHLILFCTRQPGKERPTLP